VAADCTALQASIPASLVTQWNGKIYFVYAYNMACYGDRRYMSWRSKNVFRPHCILPSNGQYLVHRVCKQKLLPLASVLKFMNYFVCRLCHYKSFFELRCYLWLIYTLSITGGWGCRRLRLQLLDKSTTNRSNGVCVWMLGPISITAARCVAWWPRNAMQRNAQLWWK